MISTKGGGGGVFVTQEHQALGNGVLQRGEVGVRKSPNLRDVIYE